VVAFLVSCLALGRASLVVKAGRDLLGRIGPQVALRLRSETSEGWTPVLQGFVYRFFPAAKVQVLLEAVGAVLRRFGSLEEAWKSTRATGWDALGAFSGLFRAHGGDLGVLVPVTGSAGAAKRLNLFLRWVVRSDAIDLGLWSAVGPQALYMPVDTHVLQWARAEGLTHRKVADRRACWEISKALRSVAPEDPLRYDFAITRAGMEQKGTLF